MLSLSVSRLLQDRKKAGFKGAAAPLQGPGGVPQSLFLPRPQGAKKLCNSPAFCINYTCLFIGRKTILLTRYRCTRRLQAIALPPAITLSNSIPDFQVE